MTKQYTEYFCDLYNKELFSYNDCLMCPQTYLDFPDYISCSHIKLKTNPKSNIILPKDHKYEPFNFTGKKVLVERTGGGLGDLLTITVVIKELKKQFPSAQVIMKVSKEYMPVLENNPYIDGVIGIETDIISDIFITFSNPCPAGAFECSHPRNISKSRIDIFCEYLGLSSKDKTPVFILTDKELEEAKHFLRNYFNTKKIGIALFAGEIWVSWTREANLRLIKLLIEEGYTPVVFTMKNQSPVGIHEVIDIHGMPIRFAASILKFCDVVITQDGGMSHLAGALEVPQIGLFGPTNPRYRIAMYKDSYWIVRHKGICPLSYDDNTFCWYYSRCSVNEHYPDGRTDIVPPCLSAIKAEDVFKKIKEVLDALSL